MCWKYYRSWNYISLMSCRLIPLGKSPGVRPIGIGEVLRRIIGKAVMIVIKPDIVKATAYDQLCSGLEAGCEVAVQAVSDLYELNDTHCFIQVDASNTFNSTNKQVLLHNVEIICSEISNYIINCYTFLHDYLLLAEKNCWLSKEGTTRRDPVVKGMYTIGLVPMLTMLM